jgi:6-phospho-3-hexuloisomerase
MSYIKNEKKILDEIFSVLEKNPESSEKDLVKEILCAKNIFLTGSGRSGLIAKTFAMRLMQAGKKVFVVGETITPSINKKDLIIAISGSGKTKTILDIVIEAKNSSARIACITSEEKTVLAKNSDLVILLKGKTKNKGKSIQPLGSLFEQSAFIFLEAVVLGIVKKLKLSEIKMRKKHDSLE